MNLVLGRAFHTAFCGTISFFTEAGLTDVQGCDVLWREDLPVWQSSTADTLVGTSVAQTLGGRVLFGSISLYGVFCFVRQSTLLGTHLCFWPCQTGLSKCWAVDS